MVNLCFVPFSVLIIDSSLLLFKYVYFNLASFKIFILIVLGSVETEWATPLSVPLVIKSGFSLFLVLAKVCHLLSAAFIKPIYSCNLFILFILVLFCIY